MVKLYVFPAIGYVTGLALIAVTATVNVGGSVTGCTAGLGNLIELAQMAIVTIEIQMKPFEAKQLEAVGAELDAEHRRRHRRTNTCTQASWR